MGEGPGWPDTIRLEQATQREQEDERRRERNKGDRGICLSHSLIHKSGRCQAWNPVSRPHQSQAAPNSTDGQALVHCRIPFRGTDVIALYLQSFDFCR